MKNRIFLLLAAFLVTAAVKAQSTVDSIAAKYKLVPMPEPLTIEKTFPVLGTYQLGGVDAMATTSMSTDNTNSANTASPTTAPATTEPSSSANTTVGTETANSGSVVITLDPENKGVIWVEGLPQGKFKAYLKKSPSSYRILSQKTESGEEVPEGTLIYDAETKTLKIALGKAYDDADPTAIFALNTPTGAEPVPAETEVKVKTKTSTSKTKTKITYFTATKVETMPASTETTNPAPAQQSQPDQAPQQSQPGQQPAQPGQAPQQ